MIARRNRPQTIKVLYVVFGAQLVAVFIFLALTFVIKAPTLEGKTFPYRALFAFLGVSQFIASHMIALLAVKPLGLAWRDGRLIAIGGPVDTAASYLATRLPRIVVCLSLMEAIAVYGLVSMFLGGTQQLAWVLIAAGGVGLGSLVPRIRDIATTHRELLAR